MANIMKLIRKCIIILFFLITGTVYAQENYDLSTILMRATFKIEGPCNNGTYVGTCFFVGKPSKNNPSQSYYILVTAAHVLKNIQGDIAVLNLRKRQNDIYSKILYPINIRSEGKPLWKEHPNEDIAVMDIGLPTGSGIDINLIPIHLLATDEDLKKIEIRPGDQLFVLGFPFCTEANEAGFPILRSGTIASYPILPTKSTKTMLLDFEIYRGNSGGPVFLVSQDRYYSNTFHPLQLNRLIIGLVSREFQITEQTDSLYETKKTTYPLKLGIIIHASFIKETIDSLTRLE